MQVTKVFIDAIVVIQGDDIFRNCIPDGIWEVIKKSPEGPPYKIFLFSTALDDIMRCREFWRSQNCSSAQFPRTLWIGSRATELKFICPYRAQRNLIKSTLDQEELGYKDILTIDAAQGQEAPVVFLLLTKPSENPKSLGFNADRNRLNVAISRAQKVFVIIGNLQVWDKSTAEWMTKAGNARFLGKLLFDVVTKGNVLTWVDRNTIETTSQIPGDASETQRHEVAGWPGVRTGRRFTGPKASRPAPTRQPATSCRPEMRHETPPISAQCPPQSAGVSTNSPSPRHTPERQYAATSRLPERLSRTIGSDRHEAHMLPPRPPAPSRFPSQIQGGPSSTPTDPEEERILQRMAGMQVNIHTQEERAAIASGNRSRAEYEAAQLQLDIYRRERDRREGRERSRSPRTNR